MTIPPATDEAITETVQSIDDLVLRLSREDAIAAWESVIEYAVEARDALVEE